jgi:signal transduction histidine kinase
VAIDVTNPGAAIDPAELPRIFEQFYTTPEGQARGGTGLGLPIAREISRAHGGDLTAESQDGQTTFRVLLPAGASGRDAVVTPTPLTAGPTC